jgi:hypothetical protein
MTKGKRPKGRKAYTMTPEQIIKGLECCQTQYNKNCEQCPYKNNKKHYISAITCESILKSDLLKLIKGDKNQ